MNLSFVGEGKVQLIAGGGKTYTDVAARFIRSEKTLDEILALPEDIELVRKIVNSGHKSIVEFDYFIFGIEGYARVTEVQLVRKRLASYAIKTGRADKNGKRSFDIVLPSSITGFTIPYKIGNYTIFIDARKLIEITEAWYSEGIRLGYKEEDLRYMKQQGTEFKAIIGMNAHALNDWFQIRCCRNAQTEIRDLAMKMLSLCKQASPELFIHSGPNCQVLGYCPENEFQNKWCKEIAKIVTKDKALEILKNINS